jgi:hypothetical protein
MGANIYNQKVIAIKNPALRGREKVNVHYGTSNIVRISIQLAPRPEVAQD